VSLTHTDSSASAIAWADPKTVKAPWYGSLIYHVLPWRRAVVMSNLRRVFGDVLADAEIQRLAKTYYAHLIHFLLDFVRLRLMSEERRKSWVRIENMDIPLKAHALGNGILLLTGHFGNWEVSTVAGLGQFPQYRDLFHFVRRPLKPQWLNDLVVRRFRRSGFGALSKRGSLDEILDLLAKGSIVGFIMDQHAGKGDGVVVDFLGHPAGTFKSLAILALNTGAPVIPASTWREADGSHVLRFEEPLPVLECEDVGEAIRKNTRAYNVALERILLRHPEQWIWMHRRWKSSERSESDGRGKDRINRMDRIDGRV
jgi:KDO2-lipid IV(A) lauroyltransferase